MRGLILERLYGVLKDRRLVYQSESEDMAQAIASKTKGELVTIFVYKGTALTTFNTEPHPTEEVHKYVDRLVSFINYARDIIRDLSVQNACLIAEAKRKDRLMLVDQLERMKDA